MKSSGLLAANVLGIFLLVGASRAQQPTSSCRVSDGVSRLRELPEASGLAASRRTPGVLWSHNDSGEPTIFALTAAGAVTDRVRVTGARVEDWEDIAVGSCPHGSCLYIADIGDNNARRRTITVYRTAEPTAGATRTENAEAMHATYPEGPQDAEALVVLPSGELFIVTKGDTGPVALYRFPSPFRNGASVALERVAVLVPAQSNGKRKGKNSPVGSNRRVTSADASPDGRWIVLRTGKALTFYDARELVAGNIREVLRFDVAQLGEPQGEAVAFSASSDVWLAGEGGQKFRPGTLARLSCTLE